LDKERATTVIETLQKKKGGGVYTKTKMLRMMVKMGGRVHQPDSL